MKSAILLVAYGAAGAQNTTSLRLFEQQVHELFPNTSVRWAFTSPLIRRRLTKAGKKSDSVHKALSRLNFENFEQITVQSLHLIPGREYRHMLEEIELAAGSAASNNFKAGLSVGLPLLNTEEDIEETAGALLQSLPFERKSSEIALWVGHGTAQSGRNFYALLQESARKLDKNILISTLEEGPEQVLPLLDKYRGAKIWLLPLLSIVGKHTYEDLAGVHRHSWRSILELNNYNCSPVSRGLIEYNAFTGIWIRHLRQAQKDPQKYSITSAG
jgi:sirohydrochlorin cobaltochelatase